MRGQYVGLLGYFSGCLTLATSTKLYEIYLSSAYRLGHPPVGYVIIDTNGNTVAKEGDWVGLDAEPSHGGGSACQLGGPDGKLDVTQIVDILPGSGT